jgi:hypothetical protein
MIKLEILLISIRKGSKKMMNYEHELEIEFGFEFVFN